MNYDIDSQIKLIQEKLIEQGYANRLINYIEFLTLYEPYKKIMSEREFFQMLGLKYPSFYSFKKGLNRVRILKDYKIGRDINPRNIEIQEQIAKEVLPGTGISYSELLELYAKYKDKFDIKDFAKIIGITNGNLNNMKYRNRKAKILKFMIKSVTEERKRDIQDKIINIGLVNKAISYDIFEETYQPYKSEMSEETFANILGINYNAYRHMKSGSERAIILFETPQNNRVKYEFSETGYYSIEQIEAVAIKYNMTTEQILEILFKRNEYYINYIKQFLPERGKIFIGEKEVSEEFMNQYGEKLAEIAYEYSKAVGINLHTSRYSEDIAQDALLKIFKTKGDVVENLSGEAAFEVIRRNMKVRIKYKNIDCLKLKKNTSLDEKISPSDNRTRYYRVASDRDTQNEVIDSEETSEDSNIKNSRIIATIHGCLINGMSRNQALKYVQNRYKVTEEQLLRILELELRKTKQIKTAADGSKYLGEKE